MLQRPAEIAGVVFRLTEDVFRHRLESAISNLHADIQRLFPEAASVIESSGGTIRIAQCGRDQPPPPWIGQSRSERLDRVQMAAAALVTASRDVCAVRGKTEVDV